MSEARSEKRRQRRPTWALTAPLVIAALLGGGLPATAGFANRKLVTIDGSRVVGGPHANFPVVVAVTDPELRLAPAGGVRSALGCDIAFRASDGVTPLDHELVGYAPAMGMLAAYVELPSIENLVNTQFYIYYGDPEVDCQQTRHGDVWDAGYRSVFHLMELSGNPVDSTSNGVAGRDQPAGRPGGDDRPEQRPGAGDDHPARAPARDLHPDDRLAPPARRRHAPRKHALHDRGYVLLPRRERRAVRGPGDEEPGRMRLLRPRLRRSR